MNAESFDGTTQSARRPTSAEVRDVITAAIQAPSADNIIHAGFEPHASGLRIYADGAFLACRERHRRVLTLISYGAIGANVRIALSRYGIDFAPQWFPDRSEPTLLLDLRWDALHACRAPDPLHDVLSLRHTNRRLLYKGPRLSACDLETLEAASAEGRGDRIRVNWMDTPTRRRAVLKLVRAAETGRFRSQPLHAELFGAVRFDAGWTRSAEEGLPPGALEVEFGLRGFFASLRHWRVMRVANLLGASSMLGFRVGDLPCRFAPHAGVISSSLPLEQAAIAVGYAFERLWLQATKLGLQLQPLAAATVLPLQQSAGEGTSDRFRAQLAAGWRALIPDQTPLIVFRLGRGEPASMRTARPPLDGFLLPAKTKESS